MELAQGPPLLETLREKLVQHVVTEHFLESGTVPAAGWHPCSARSHTAGETERVQVKHACLNAAARSGGNYTSLESKRTLRKLALFAKVKMSSHRSSISAFQTVMVGPMDM